MGQSCCFLGTRNGYENKGWPTCECGIDGWSRYLGNNGKNCYQRRQTRTKIHEATPGKQEYKNSEKYEIRNWDWNMENKLTHIIRLTNQARIENTALQRTNNTTFCDIQNDNLLAYLRTAWNGNRIFAIVNLDPYNTQSGYMRIPLYLIFKHPDEEYIVHDLLTGAKYFWRGEYNAVELNPNLMPMHLFRIEDL